MRSNSKLLTLFLIYIALIIIRPWESISYILDFKIERYTGYVLIIYAILSNKLRVISSPLNATVYLMLASHFILSLSSFDSTFALDQSIEYFKIIITYIIALTACENEDDLVLFIKVFVVATMIYTAHSLLEFYNGRHVYRMGIVRLTGVGWTYNDPNTFAASISLSFPFIIFLIKTSKSIKIKLIYCLYIVIGILCVFMTGSRSGLLSIILFALLFIFLWTKNHFFRNITVLCLLLITILTVLPDSYKTRIETIWNSDVGNESAHQSTKGRVLGFQAGWAMFKARPLTGIGVGSKNFINYRVEYLDGIKEQSHNLLGEILGEMGLVGIILFSMLVYKIIITSHNIRIQSSNFILQELSLSIIITVIGLLFLGLGGHNYYRPLWVWLAAWTSLAYRFSNVTADTSTMELKNE